MMTLSICILVALVFSIICATIAIVGSYRAFQALEVGDVLCTDYTIDDNDDCVPVTTTKVVSVKRDADDKIESITFDNDVTFTSYHDYFATKWFILNED